MKGLGARNAVVYETGKTVVSGPVPSSVQKTDRNAGHVAAVSLRPTGRIYFSHCGHGTRHTTEFRESTLQIED